jgi:hypothetical protein
LYDESVKFAGKPGALTVTRVVRVEPYIDFPAVMASLLGTVALAGGVLVRIPPARDPWTLAAVCTAVDVEGVGVYGTGSAGAPAFVLATANGYEQGARLTVTYQTPDADKATQDAGQGDAATPQQEVELASESFEFSSQALTLPNDRYKWTGTTALLQQTGTQATKVLPRIEYSLQRHYVLTLPFQAITKLLGKVNTNALLVNGKNWPAECLRFDGATATRKINFQGLAFYDVTYKWAGQPVYDVIEDASTTYVTWQRVYRPDTGKWEKPVLVSDGLTQIYKVDTLISQTIKGTTYSGFPLLFHPGAV